MNICILINKDLNPNTYAFVYPILINFKNFEKLTIDIVFDIKEKNYDIILIDSKFFIKQFINFSIFSNYLFLVSMF